MVGRHLNRTSLAGDVVQDEHANLAGPFTEWRLTFDKPAPI